jgi:hypothetical protein
MSFRIAGLDPAEFADVLSLSAADLAARGVQPVVVDDHPGAPCRISLDDAAIGETVLLLNYDHQPAQTPYRQQGPIFIRANARRFSAVDEIPPALKRRTLSLRGFDAGHMMVEAELTPGVEAGDVARRMFANANVAYIHAHYATRGCFAAMIERA